MIIKKFIKYPYPYGNEGEDIELTPMEWYKELCNSRCGENYYRV